MRQDKEICSQGNSANFSKTDANAFGTFLQLTEN